MLCNYGDIKNLHCRKYFKKDIEFAMSITSSTTSCLFAIYTFGLPQIYSKLTS